MHGVRARVFFREGGLQGTSRSLCVSTVLEKERMTRKPLGITDVWKTVLWSQRYEEPCALLVL